MTWLIILGIGSAVTLVGVFVAWVIVKALSRGPAG